MVRWSSLSRSLSILLSAITLALLSSCTQSKGISSVKITIPDFSKVKSKTFSQSISAQSGGGGDWGLSDPTAISEFKCFGIFVGGADSGLDAGKAHDSNNNLIFTFGISQGLVGPGGTLSLSVPSGPRRTITLIGFALINGASCESMTNQSHEITSQNYSAPFILAQTTVDLSPGTSAPVTMNASFSVASVKLGEVDFPGSSGGGSGGGSAIQLGSGADGDITIFETFADLSIKMNSSSTRILSTSAAINNLVRPNPVAEPSKFKVEIPSGYGSTHFGLNDEVMLYIYAEKAGVGSGCGSLVSGFRVPGKVLGSPYGSGPYYVDVSFADSTRVASIPNANLVASSSSANFCRASINRVPHINRLTFNAGKTLKAAPFSGLSGPTSDGGVLFIRVRDSLEVSGAGIATISMSQSGYRGGLSAGYPGEGEQGVSPMISTNSIGAGGGGGGSGPTYAGGGAHGNAGAAGMGGSNGGSMIGDSFGCNESFPGNLLMHCLLGKIFMGGGGGAYAAAGANHGGGAIAIFANQITVAAGQTLKVETNGAHGFSNGAGGAGGAILIRALRLQVSGAAESFHLLANGGDASGNDGAGSGGRVHLDVVNSCNVAPGSVEAEVAGGISYISAGDGTRYITGSASSSCPLPATSPAL